MKEEKIICPSCGGTVKKKVATLDHPKRGKLPNLPHEQCLDCGEIFFGPDSYQVIRSLENQAQQTV